MVIKTGSWITAGLCFAAALLVGGPSALGVSMLIGIGGGFLYEAIARSSYGNPIIIVDDRPPPVSRWWHWGEPANSFFYNRNPNPHVTVVNHGYGNERRGDPVVQRRIEPSNVVQPNDQVVGQRVEPSLNNPLPPPPGFRPLFAARHTSPSRRDTVDGSHVVRQEVQSRGAHRPGDQIVGQRVERSQNPVHSQAAHNNNGDTIADRQVQPRGAQRPGDKVVSKKVVRRT